MPRTPRSLIAAARVGIAEDRLTDLVAACANRSVEFANALLALGGLEPGTRAVTRTQIWTSSGRRVDMEIVALDDNGAELSRAWFENKVGAAYQDAQLEDYADDLASVAPSGRVVTVVPDLRHAPVDPTNRWMRSTWHDVARAAWTSGRLISDHPAWRARAGSSDARADLAVLDELLRYLEKEYDVVADPLAPGDVLAFAGFARAYETLDALMQRAALVTGLGHDDAGWADDGGSAWRIFEVPSSWAAPLGGWVELHLGDADYWAIDRREHPAFGAGLTLPWPLLDQIRDAQRQDWRQHILSSGFSLYIGEDERLIRVYRTKYLVELMTAGTTLDQQARHLADWARAAISDIHRLVPEPPFAVPESTRRRRQADRDADSQLRTSAELPAGEAPPR